MTQDTSVTKVKPQQLKNAEFDSAVAAAGDKPMLVDFYADWCGPCKMIAPVLEELANEYDGKAVVAKVNVDEEHELAQRFGVMSIPTLLIFKNGQPVDKQIGFASKSALATLITKQL